MTTFVMVTHGTAGDVLPFIRIGAVLRQRGHDVSLVSHAPFATAAIRQGLEFVALDDAARYERHLAGTPDLLAARVPGEIADFYRTEGLFRQCVVEVEAMLARHRPGDTVFVGRHTSGASTLFAAEATGAPAVWVAVAPAQTMLAPLAAVNCRDALGDDLNGVRAGVGLAPIDDWIGWFSSADLTVGLWPDWFDRAGTPAPPEVRLTGFVLGDETERAPVPPAVTQAFAGRQAPVVLTGGTGRLLHADYYRIAVDAVAETGRPGLLVVRHRDLVPDRLPPGIRWVPRAPFAAVLPKAAALLHHGGIGTAVRALCARTPQVMMAYGADRPDNGRRLAEAGVAAWVPLPQWTPERLAAALTDAMADTSLPARAAALPGMTDGGAVLGAEAAGDALERAHTAERVPR